MPMNRFGKNNPNAVVSPIKPLRLLRTTLGQNPVTVYRAYSGRYLICLIRASV